MLYALQMISVNIILKNSSPVKPIRCSEITEMGVTRLYTLFLYEKHKYEKQREGYSTFSVVNLHVFFYKKLVYKKLGLQRP